MAKTLKASGVPAYSIGGADGWTLTDLFENIYLRTAGPDKYDQLSKHQIPWTDPSVTTALQDMAQIFSDTGNIAGGTSGALQTDFPTSVSNVFTDPPKAAMVFEGDFVQGVIASSTTAQPETGFNQFAFPSVDGSGPTVVGGGDTLVTFKDDPATRAFVEYLATPQAGESWAKLGGFASPNKNVDPTLSRRDLQGYGDGAREGGDLPLRHERPGAGRVRRHGRPGRVEDPAGLPQEPAGRQGHAAGPGTGGRRLQK